MNKFKITAFLTIALLLPFFSGCDKDWFDGYQQGWPYPEQIDSVFVEMFDSKSFRRDHEYALSEAIAKQVEVQTPYRIVANRDKAVSVLSGRIESISTSVLTTDRESGLALEKEARVSVVFSWKNLKTGDLLVDNRKVTGVASFSEQLSQDEEYAITVASNKAALKVVEAMQKDW